LNNTQSREGKKELTPTKTEKRTRNWQDKTCNTNTFEFSFSSASGGHGAVLLRHPKSRNIFHKNRDTMKKKQQG